GKSYRHSVPIRPTHRILACCSDDFRKRTREVAGVADDASGIAEFADETEKQRRGDTARRPHLRRQHLYCGYAKIVSRDIATGSCDSVRISAGCPGSQLFSIRTATTPFCRRTDAEKGYRLSL